MSATVEDASPADQLAKLIPMLGIDMDGEALIDKAEGLLLPVPSDPRRIVSATSPG